MNLILIAVDTRKKKSLSFFNIKVVIHKRFLLRYKEGHHKIVVNIFVKSTETKIQSSILYSCLESFPMETRFPAKENNSVLETGYGCNH